MTPRKHDDNEEERKTDGGSTPSRNGADTPTRKEYVDHQQRIRGRHAEIYDLTTPMFYQHDTQTYSEFQTTGSPTSSRNNTWNQGS